MEKLEIKLITKMIKQIVLDRSLIVARQWTNDEQSTRVWHLSPSWLLHDFKLDDDDDSKWRLFGLSLSMVFHTSIVGATCTQMRSRAIGNFTFCVSVWLNGTNEQRQNKAKQNGTINKKSQFTNLLGETMTILARRVEHTHTHTQHTGAIISSTIHFRLHRRRSSSRFMVWHMSYLRFVIIIIMSTWLIIEDWIDFSRLIVSEIMIYVTSKFDFASLYMEDNLRRILDSFIHSWMIIDYNHIIDFIE